MRSKFKVGDRVRCIQALFCAFIAVGKEYIIISVDYRGYVAVNNDAVYQHHYSPAYFELIDEVEAAKATLEAAGYTVSPSPPKAKGTFTICRHKTGERTIFGFSSQELERNGYITSSENIETLAIVDWEEGQGLDIKQCTPAGDRERWGLE